MTVFLRMCGDPLTHHYGGGYPIYNNGCVAGDGTMRGTILPRKRGAAGIIGLGRQRSQVHNTHTSLAHFLRFPLSSTSLLSFHVTVPKPNISPASTLILVVKVHRVSLSFCCQVLPEHYPHAI